MPIISFTAAHVVTAAPQQLSSKLGAETVILNIESGIYYGLNPVGARVWELSQGGAAIGEIQQQLLEEFDVPSHVLEKDLGALLTQMQAEGLVKIGVAA